MREVETILYLITKIKKKSPDSVLACQQKKGFLNNDLNLISDRYGL